MQSHQNGMLSLLQIEAGSGQKLLTPDEIAYSHMSKEQKERYTLWKSGCKVRNVTVEWPSMTAVDDKGGNKSSYDNSVKSAYRGTIRKVFGLRDGEM